MPTEAQEFQLIPDQTDGDQLKKVALWGEFRQKVEELKSTSETLTVTRTDDTEGMKLARNTRLALKEIRVAVTHHHKQLKEGILQEGRRIDAGKNELIALIEPLETRMLEQERFAERELERFQKENREKREKELLPFMTGPLAIDLGTLGEEEFQRILADAKAINDARLKREEKERLDADEKRRADERERNRLLLENNRLKKEQQKLEAEAKVERDALMEKSRKEQAELEAKLEQEREQKRQAEEELAQKRVEEAKAEAERIAKEKEAAVAPIQEKLRAYLGKVEAEADVIFYGEAMTDELTVIQNGIRKFTEWMDKKIKALGDA